MALDRRSFLAATSRLGLASTLFPGALYALALQQASGPAAAPKLKPITPEMIDAAATIADVPLEPGQRQALLESLNDHREGFAAIRALNLPNSVAPAFVFEPLPPGAQLDTTREAPRYSKAPAASTRPSNLEDLAFLPLMQLADLVRRKKVSSVALTEMYLTRLKRYDPVLHCVITLTEERAMSSARAADEDLRKGNYHGPLHGLPWGAKDLLAVKGYPTTWGAGGFEHQRIDEDATVVQRLDAAGAVLIAKLTLGALALGDVWFGGRTRNPWNLKQGSSGSSAGPASATAAGCVAFSIGSETLGSISSPSTRCGVTGLRPTFGFVPRTGAMALSWTMDKLGPICRETEDCAAVLSAIYGPDDRDLTVKGAGFHWNAEADWRSLRVGYLESAFADSKANADEGAGAKEPGATLSEAEKQAAAKRKAEHAANEARRRYDHRFDTAALEKLRSMGAHLQPVELPKLPYGAMVPLLEAEAAAAFDQLTLTGRDKLLTAQGPEDWPNTFRSARFLPAVEYIQANRARSLAVAQLSMLFEQVDVIVAPTNGDQLVATNLTGHPAVIVPNGLRGPDAPHSPSVDTGEDDSIGGPGTPVSLTFLAGHYQDAKALLLARAYEQATGFTRQHPKLPG